MRIQLLSLIRSHVEDYIIEFLTAGEGTNVKDKNTYSLETNVSIVFRKINVSIGFMQPLNSTKHQSILLIFYFLLKNSISIEYFTQNDFFPLK